MKIQESGIITKVFLLRAILFYFFYRVSIFGIRFCKLYITSCVLFLCSTNCDLWHVVSNVFFLFFFKNLFIYKKSKNNTRQVMIGEVWRKTPSLLLRNPQKMELSRLSMIGRSFPLVKQRLVRWEPSGETVSATLRSHDGGHHGTLGETIP